MSKRISWKKLFTEDGKTLVYEGYTLNGKVIRPSMVKVVS